MSSFTLPEELASHCVQGVLTRNEPHAILFSTLEQCPENCWTHSPKEYTRTLRLIFEWSWKRARLERHPGQMELFDLLDAWISRAPAGLTWTESPYYFVKTLRVLRSDTTFGRSYVSTWLGKAPSPLPTLACFELLETVQCLLQTPMMDVYHAKRWIREKILPDSLIVSSESIACLFLWIFETLLGLGRWSAVQMLLDRLNLERWDARPARADQEEEILSQALYSASCVLQKRHWDDRKFRDWYDRVAVLPGSRARRVMGDERVDRLGRR